MLEEVAFVLLWIAFSMIGLWLFLRFSPAVVRFFRGEIQEAKAKAFEGEPSAGAKRSASKGKSAK